MAANTAGQTLSQVTQPSSSITAQGKVVLDGTSLTATDYLEFTTGFKPRYVRYENLTDRIAVEWFEGMTANTCLKTAAAGTRTLETTNGGITVTNTGFRVLQNATLAVVAASTTAYWKADS